MKLLYITSLLAIASSNAADVDRRRINGITFADQAVEALNLVHKGQAGSNTEQKLVVASKGGNDKSSRDKSSNDKSSKSSSSKSSRSNSRDGRGVCGERDGYCKHYESFLSSVVASKGGDDKSSKDSKSKSSSSKSKSSSSGSRDGSRRTDRCFRACDTDRCTSADRRRLECPASTAASSDFVQKGQASPIQKLVWAGKKKGEEGGEDPANPPAPGKKSTSPDDPNDPDNKKNRDNSKSSSSSKSKSSSSTGTSGDGNSRSWPGSGDDICVDAPKDWCVGSSADGDDKCDDACDAGSDIRCDEKQRKHLGCDKTSGDVAAVKKLRRRKA